MWIQITVVKLCCQTKMILIDFARVDEQ